MATTRQPREKITTTPSAAPPVRRAPRASLTASPDREIHPRKQPPAEKPIPNYLKPIVRTTATKPTAVSTSTATRPPARKSVPSPTPRPPSRERPAPRTSPAPSPRASVSPRPSLDKSARTPRKIPASSTSTVKKRTRPAAVAHTDHYASDASSYKSETEEKHELPVLESEAIAVDHADLLDISPLNDHVLLDDLPEPVVLKVDPEVVSEAEMVKEDEIAFAPSIVHDEEHAEVDEKPMVVGGEEGNANKEVENVTEEKPSEVIAAVEKAAAVDVRARQVEKKEGPKNNEVIEEFKSKMMEKRKNKVLALVGAFETVMSMQEPTVPSTQQPAVKGGAAPPSGGAAPPEDGGSSTEKESTEST